MQYAWSLYYSDSMQNSNNVAELQDHLLFKPPEEYHHRCDNTIHLVFYKQNRISTIC
jgi:hypothetical protein